jgi:hypothetical protein
MEQVLGSSSDDVLERPVPGGRSLRTDERATIDLSAAIAGWGSDLEPTSRPGVPRDKAPEIGVEYLYPPSIPRQIPRTRIHKSTEHARLTPVFGTSCPPRGLSGWLRDAAYRYSEGRMARWLTLMVADRVDVVEGVARDVATLRGPNISREMGWRSEWRYNRAAFIGKAAVLGIGLLALYVIATRLHEPRG